MRKYFILPNAKPGYNLVDVRKRRVAETDRRFALLPSEITAMSEQTPQSPVETPPLLGCVADDVTGATDLSLNLVQGGMRVVQWLGSPTVEELRRVEADAIVVALKSRSVEAADAINMSLSALQTLQTVGCRRFYFKYCSTFDSTAEGNIGPVAEALLQELGGRQAIFCPAFPAAGRTVYAGHLFVNGCPLHESGMQNHPLNPMHDPNLVRVLRQQTRQPVGLLSYADVMAGPEAIARKLRALRDEGRPLVVVDALDAQHLRSIAAACADDQLVTGGSGLARFLPEVYRAQGMLAAKPYAPALPAVAGRSAILSGSCSQATRAQVARQCEWSASWKIDVAQLMNQPDVVFREIIDWVGMQPVNRPLLIYSTADPEYVTALQERFGRALVADRIEQMQARIAEVLVADYGVRRLVVAGGETSAAVAAALDVRALRIGPEIAPGVPWTESLRDPPLALAFKSGNFGGEDFFRTALEMLG